MAGLAAYFLSFPDYFAQIEAIANRPLPNGQTRDLSAAVRDFMAQNSVDRGGDGVLGVCKLRLFHLLLNLLMSIYRKLRTSARHEWAAIRMSSHHS